MSYAHIGLELVEDVRADQSLYPFHAFVPTAERIKMLNLMYFAVRRKAVTPYLTARWKRNELRRIHKATVELWRQPEMYYHRLTARRQQKRK